MPDWYFVKLLFILILFVLITPINAFSSQKQPDNLIMPLSSVMKWTYLIVFDVADKLQDLLIM